MGVNIYTESKEDLLNRYRLRIESLIFEYENFEFRATKGETNYQEFQNTTRFLSDDIKNLETLILNRME